MRRRLPYCGAQTGTINRFTAWQYCALAWEPPAGDIIGETRLTSTESGHGFVSTGLQEIDDCRCQHSPRHCR